jgi:hypothetical protein
MSKNPLIIMAKDPNTPPEVLRDLSKIFEYIIRGFVAQNPSTPTDVLKKLAEDDLSHVRYCIMRNSNATEDIIMLAKAVTFIREHQVSFILNQRRKKCN